MVTETRSKISKPSSGSGLLNARELIIWTFKEDRLLDSGQYADGMPSYELLNAFRLPGRDKTI